MSNVAQLHLANPGGGERTTPSNAVALTIAERIDVTLVRDGAGDVVVTADGVAVPFVLRNAGNGDEAFAIAAAVSDAGIGVRAVVVDTNGDGRYDSATDTMIVDGRTATIAPGATLTMFVVLDRAATPGSAATLSLTATAVTGSGAPGTVFAGQGDGGSDAVTGPTGGSAQASAPIATGATAPTFVKSQSVVAPDGSANAVRDAVVTYTLAARFGTATRDAHIVDPIPTGTRYVPGSLTLDGVPLSDVADADAGGVGADGVAVTLGDIAAPATRTVRFQVIIQ